MLACSKQFLFRGAHQSQAAGQTVAMPHAIKQMLPASAGGSLSCDTVTANKVDFKTNGGQLAVKRLLGKQCLLDTCPGAMSFPQPPAGAEGQAAGDAERYVHA